MREEFLAQLEQMKKEAKDFVLKVGDDHSPTDNELNNICYLTMKHFHWEMREADFQVVKMMAGEIISMKDLNEKFAPAVGSYIWDHLLGEPDEILEEEVQDIAAIIANSLFTADEEMRNDINTYDEPPPEASDCVFIDDEETRKQIGEKIDAKIEALSEAVKAEISHRVEAFSKLFEKENVNFSDIPELLKDDIGWIEELRSWMGTYGISYEEIQACLLAIVSTIAMNIGAMTQQQRNEYVRRVIGSMIIVAMKRTSN